MIFFPCSAFHTACKVKSKQPNIWNYLNLQPLMNFSVSLRMSHFFRQKVSIHFTYPSCFQNFIPYIGLYFIEQNYTLQFGFDIFIVKVPKRENRWCMETDEYHSEDFNGFDLLSACQQHATYCVGPESISLLDQSVLSGGTTRCWDKTTLIKWFVKSCPYQCYIILEVSGGEVTHKQIDCCFTSCDRCRVR